MAEEYADTTLRLLGVGDWTRTANQAAGVVDALSNRLDSLNRISVTTGAAAGAITLGLGKAALAAGAEAAAMQRASIAFQSHGKSFPTSELSEFTSQMQAITGVADDQVAGFVGLLGTFDLTKEQAKQLTPAILDAAEALKAQGVSAESLAVQIGKALQMGSSTAMRRSGIMVDEARFKYDRFGAVLDAVSKQGAGAAQAFRQTLPGSIMAFNNAIGDVTEALGSPLVGPLNNVANLATKGAQAFNELPGPMKTAATAAGVVLAGGLAIVSTGAKIAAMQSAFLLRQHLLNAAAADKQAAAEGRLAAVLGVQGRAAGAAAAVNAGKAVGVGTAGSAAANTAAGVAGGAVAGKVAGGVAGRMGAKAAAGMAARTALKFIPGVGLALTAAELGYMGYQAWQGSQGGGAPGGKPGAQAAPTTPEVEALRQQVALQQQQIELLKGLRRDLQVDVVRGPGGVELRGAEMARAAAWGS